MLGALFGLYVLYRRRNISSRKKPRKSRNAAQFVVSGDISAPDAPPAIVTVRPVPQWQVGWGKSNSLHSHESDREAVLSWSDGQSQSGSAADSSSLDISSLHSSERTDE